MFLVNENEMFWIKDKEKIRSIRNRRVQSKDKERFRVKVKDFHGMIFYLFIYLLE